MKKIALLSLSVIFMLTSCASKYNLLSPETASFSSVSKENGVELSYDYMKLRKKYAKKANDTDIKIAAVKIKNTTDNAITYNDDFKFTTSQGDFVEVLSSNDVYDKLKQQPGTHFLYLLLTPMQLQSGDSSTPIGLLVGPGIALGNYFTAKGANTKFEDEVKKYSIYNEQIAPGETKTFLVPIRHSSFPSLKLKFN